MSIYDYIVITRITQNKQYLTVLCQTMLKLTGEQKFCVTAIVVSKFITTCHHPPGMNTVSPGQ